MPLLRSCFTLANFALLTHCGTPTTSACTQRLEGIGPIGFTLQGEAEYCPWGRTACPDRSTTVGATNEIYFPQGRIPGARVLIAGRPQINRGLSVWEATLDAQSRAVITATNLPAGSQGQPGWTLLEPEYGVQMYDVRNLAMRSDVANYVEGNPRLCPMGVAPQPQVRPREPIGAISPLVLNYNAPLDPTHVSYVVYANGVAVDTSLALVDGQIVITPTTAFPPNADLTIDTGSTRDVLGRVVTVAAQPFLLRTTAEVTDGTFATPPPMGSIVANTNIDVTTSGISIGNPRGLNIGGPYSAMIALGNPANATRLRIRVGFEYCTEGALSVAVVNASGQRTAITTQCPSGGGEQVVALPGPGPYWLAVASTQAPWDEQSLPSGGQRMGFGRFSFE